MTIYPIPRWNAATNRQNYQIFWYCTHTAVSLRWQYNSPYHNLSQICVLEISNMTENVTSETILHFSFFAVIFVYCRTIDFYARVRRRHILNSCSKFLFQCDRTATSSIFIDHTSRMSVYRDDYLSGVSSVLLLRHTRLHPEQSLIRP